MKKKKRRRLERAIRRLERFGQVQLRHYRMGTGESACGRRGTTCTDPLKVNCRKCIREMLRYGILKLKAKPKAA